MPPILPSPMTIFRTGSLSADLHPSIQCGNPGQVPFAYSVRLSSTVLDSRHFIVDNNDIDVVMQSLARTPRGDTFIASCEQLCLSAVVAFVTGFPRLDSVFVEISPTPGRGVSYSWTKGQPLPSRSSLSQPVPKNLAPKPSPSPKSKPEPYIAPAPAPKPRSGGAC